MLQPNGALLVLSDGSLVLFLDATVPAIQQAIRVVWPDGPAIGAQRLTELAARCRRLEL